MKATVHQLLPDSLARLADSDTAKALLAAAAPAAAVGAYLLYCWHQGRDLPPGPKGIPLLGRLPWTDAKNLHLSALQACDKYGDICSFYLGSRLFVVVNSYPMVKELLEDPLFAGRPQSRLFQKLTRGQGILFQDGETVAQQRRLSLRILRDFGFARNQTVEMADDQLDSIFRSLDHSAATGEPTRVLEDFILATNSIITEMTLGHRFDRNDPEFRRVNAIISRLMKGGIVQAASFLIPVVELVAELLPASSPLVNDVESLHEFIRCEIRKREKVMAEESSEPACLCDAYLLEKRNAERLTPNSGTDETIKEFRIIRVCLEFYLAGTDTTARSLEWLMLYMAFHPDVQDRVHREILDVVGQSRRPRMQDKTELHYTCATIDEGYRTVSLTPTGGMHRAMEDAKFHGFRIPKDAAIIPLTYGIHHRADYWERPHEFYPEHFLDDKGHYRASPYLVPFLIGRRSCLGESLARMEIFLFFSAIMQRYRVRPTADSLARQGQIFLGEFGTVRIPGDYRLVFSRR